MYGKLRQTASECYGQLQPPSRAPPLELAITFRCSLAQLSIHGGTDFADVSNSKMHTRTAAPEVRTAHLTLQFQESVIKLMDFTPPHAGDIGFLSNSCIFKRQLI